MFYAQLLFYQSKFTEEYFKSLQSQIEEMHHLAIEFTKSCPCDEERVPQGDSREAVFITLQESYDSLSSTVNEKCEMLQQHIELWHNYNDLKAAVSTIIEDVQGSVDKLNERSHDPAVPPTTIVDSTNVHTDVCLCVYVYIFICVCIPFSRKVWWVESLANLVNRLRFIKLKPSKLVVTISNPLADLFICQTFFWKRINSPNTLLAKLSLYAVHMCVLVLKPSFFAI